MAGQGRGIAGQRPGLEGGGSRPEAHLANQEQPWHAQGSRGAGCRDGDGPAALSRAKGISKRERPKEVEACDGYRAWEQAP